jgi:drug/metabolite transporter (DMT)-like permease
MGLSRYFRTKKDTVKDTSVGAGSHRAAVLQALMVTFLWSTSWVLIKTGLQDIPALTFAGLRYFLAFICLMPFALRSGYLKTLRGMSVAGWGRLILLGVLLITVTQGAQFMGLAYLPAVTVNLLFSLTTLLVAFLGIVILAERPSILQWAGVVSFLIGVYVYFYPLSLPSGEVFGLIIVLVGVVTNAFSSVLGRYINRMRDLHPLAVTTVSIGVGGALLLLIGILVQGLPPLEPLHWLIIAWLALVNTAFAFTIWNQTLRTLSAVESNIINNTMLIQIAILAWLFLGETLSWRQIFGMLLVALGTVIVQLRNGQNK